MVTPESYSIFKLCHPHHNAAEDTSTRMLSQLFVYTIERYATTCDESIDLRAR